MNTIISTKSLSDSQQKILSNTGFIIEHYDIITPIILPFPILSNTLNHVIVTSKNAIKAVDFYKDKVKYIYVVGEKTAQMLIRDGYHVCEIASNAQELSQIIINKYPQEHFTYLCGVHRRDELPDALLSTQISFTEVKVYDTTVIKKSFDCIFDAVLLFSPRGVYAFAKANPQNLHLAICIGETTATTAREYFKRVIVAQKATVENTITTAVKALSND